MCLFSFANKTSLKALVKGVEKFECGGCPECLQKKSRLWALRCGMEAKNNIGFMCTLTYDTYKNGKDGEENPVDPNLPLSKAHAQRFIKRLRKHFSGKTIKYLLSAERGKKTHRAHYHALIFGVQFDDLRFYKKSARGNIIYKSPTLEKIWAGDKEHNGGICTVDCVNPSVQVARYCTKYCAKDSGIDDTFMLFSRGIGDKELLKRFNGRSYWIDGREYSIPRQIWQKVIEKKYNIQGYSRYVGKNHIYESGKALCSKLDKNQDERKKLRDRLFAIRKSMIRHESYLPKKRGFRSARVRDWWNDRYDVLLSKHDKLLKLLEENVKQKDLLWKIACSKMDNQRKYDRATSRRELYQAFRDQDLLYKRYLAYWKKKNEVNNLTRPDEKTRILQLPLVKYFGYKARAVKAKVLQDRKISFIPPRSKTQGFVNFPEKEELCEKAFAPLSRHYRANDTDINRKTELFGFTMVTLAVAGDECWNFSEEFLCEDSGKTGEILKISFIPKNLTIIL